METSPIKIAYSAFSGHGLKSVVRSILDHIKQLYLSDQIPWVVGYSGGKDSTAVLQLVWTAIQELDAEKKARKPVYIISTDTLVENPIVAMWVERSLEQMLKSRDEQGLGMLKPHRLTPEVKDRFWVNLIGKGYPAPRHKFRWCTDRLKINPSNNFINKLVSKNGEAILVLGTRKAESSARAATMDHYENKDNTRKADGLSSNKFLDRVWVYSPISDWSNDDVWTYLNQYKNPWNFPNTELLGMYQGATEGGECPLVVDKDTPSCGDSRFGCYVCTMVTEDKSMAAMIANDEEKEWMLPLLALRSEIDVNAPNRQDKLKKLTRDKHNRDFRRMDGSLTVHISKHGADIVPGPYLQVFREYLLRKVLEAQKAVQIMGPPQVQTLELLPLVELEAIRAIWLDEKLEIEDNLPRIYEEVFKKPYPGLQRASHPIINPAVLTKLKEHCAQKGDTDGLLYQQARAAIAIANKHRNLLRRANLYSELEDTLKKGAFDNLEQAKKFALERKRHDLEIQERNAPNLSEEEREKLREDIAMITRSLKEQGYSSLRDTDFEEEEYAF